MYLQVNLTDIVGIVTALGVIGTLSLGILNLRWSIIREAQMRTFSEYEKHKDKLLSLCAEVITLLDIESVLIRVQNLDEFRTESAEVANSLLTLSSKLTVLELYISESNPYAHDLKVMLREAVDLLDKIKMGWQFITLNSINKSEKNLAIQQLPPEFERAQFHKFRDSTERFEALKPLIIKCIKNYTIFEDRKVTNSRTKP